MSYTQIVASRAACENQFVDDYVLNCCPIEENGERNSEEAEYLKCHNEIVLCELGSQMTRSN